MNHDLHSTSTEALKHFVREQLGCTCPDEVFDSIAVTPSPAWFAGLPGDCLATVGNRLLILIVDAPGWNDVAPHLERLLLRGCALRDAGDYSRFRLVIALPAGAHEAQPLTAKCKALLSADTHLHLHLVQSAVLDELGLAAP